MAIPGQGHLAYLQFGKESAYGGGATPTSKVELINWDVPADIGLIRDPSLWNNPARRKVYPGPLAFRGTFTVRCGFDGVLEILRGCMGSYSASTVETGVRDHVFKQISLLPSYEMQVSLGDITAGTVFRLRGAKFIGATFAVTAGDGEDGLLTLEVTVHAKECTPGQTPTGAAAFPAFVDAVLYHQAITVDDGTADAASSIRVRSLRVALDQPHNERRDYMGARTPDEPLRSGHLVPTWTLEQEFITLTKHNAVVGATEGSPRFVFQHPTTIGVSSKREFEIRSGSAVLSGYKNPIEDYDVVMEEATWEAYHDATDASALYVRVRNTEAALA